MTTETKSNFFLDPLTLIATAVVTLGSTVLFDLESGTAMALAVGAYIFFFVAVLPIHIAQRKKHPHLLPICVLTIIGCFTGILWVIALVWALVDIPQPKEPA